MNVDRATVLEGRIWDLDLKIRVLELTVGLKSIDPEYKKIKAKEIERLKGLMSELKKEREKTK